MVNILVLNYARPAETEKCLKSIKEFCLFEHQVILLNNGKHDFERVFNFQAEKLADQILHTTENKGGGFGTVELFERFVNDNSEYSLWIECDCEIAGPISQEAVNSWINFLETNTDNVKCIDLTGGICGQNIYSGRSFFINTEFYNSINKFELDENGEKVYGGPGPYNHIKYLEQFIQEEFKEKGYKVAHVRAIKDNGYSSVRENPDGSQYIHQPDRKGLKVLKYPKVKYMYPKWTDEEWDYVLKGGKWNDWDIPEQEKNHSFIVPQWHE